MGDIAKFTPSTGIVVDRTGQSTSITGAMELYGAEATAARAASVESSINSTWTQRFSDGYSVSCKVTVKFREPGSSAGKATQIEAVKISGPSHVSPNLLGGKSMTLNANESDAFTWTAAHEFGHIIGMDDRYSEGIISKIKGTFGGSRSTSIQTGYGGNIMGVCYGVLESKNLVDLASENSPNPYWDDDDQVRDWISAHSIGEIAKLSTATKLDAFRTLMSEWISDEDVDAMKKICQSITTTVEANKLRSAVNVPSFSSLGQRTAIRVAFAKMPK